MAGDAYGQDTIMLIALSDCDGLGRYFFPLSQDVFLGKNFLVKMTQIFLRIRLDKITLLYIFSKRICNKLRKNLLCS